MAHYYEAWEVDPGKTTTNWGRQLFSNLKLYKQSLANVNNVLKLMIDSWDNLFARQKLRPEDPTMIGNINKTLENLNDFIRHDDVYSSPPFPAGIRGVRRRGWAFFVEKLNDKDTLYAGFEPGGVPQASGLPSMPALPLGFPNHKFEDWLDERDMSLPIEHTLTLTWNPSGTDVKVERIPRAAPPLID